MGGKLLPISERKIRDETEAIPFFFDLKRTTG